MAVLTIREKNQVTIPAAVLALAGLRQGDPIECSALPDGGVAIKRYANRTHYQSLWDQAVAIADSVPGIEDTDLELPDRTLDLRPVEL